VDAINVAQSLYTQDDLDERLEYARNNTWSRRVDGVINQMESISQDLESYRPCAESLVNCALTARPLTVGHWYLSVRR
jgi:hypothetical protein